MRSGFYILEAYMKRRHFLKGIGAAAVPIAGCDLFDDNKDGKKKETNETEPTPTDTMSYTILGKTGIEVSRFGFGSHLKTSLIADPVTRDAMIKRGYEGGITFFDVYNHSGYNQFKPMGESIKDFRKSVVVSLCAVNATASLNAEIDGALADFKTDYIDLYRLYSIDDTRMNIMEKARDAGKIRAIGIVDHTVAALKTHVEHYRDTLDYVMLIYNFHHNKAMILTEQTSRSFKNDYSTVFPLIAELNLGVVGIKPMGSDSMIDLAAANHYFDDGAEINIAQAMLRHVFQRPEIHTVVTAMNSMAEVEANLAAAYNPQISDKEKTALEGLSALAASTERAYLPDHYRWLEDWVVKTA